jgi:hydrogenase maturation protease
MSGRDQRMALVAGIGNPDRGDDGVGPAVARRLLARALPGVRILECTGDILALIEEWRGFSKVIVVDAVASAGELGRIHRFELGDRPFPVAFTAPSTHAFGLAQTIELARSLKRLPGDLVAYLVEGERFATGVRLSPPVAEAVGGVTERIIAELSRISAAHEAELGVADA